MYQLNDGKNCFDKNQEREKRNRAYYIFEDQIQILEEMSNGSPSQFLRRLLDKYLGEEFECPYCGRQDFLNEEIFREHVQECFE